MANHSRLRSAAGTNYELPAIRHKIGERAFLYAEPASWNSLPNELGSIADIQTCTEDIFIQACIQHVAL